jgi:transposase
MSRQSAAETKKELPSEVPVLHDMIFGLESQVHSLERQVDWFKRNAFGKKTERIATDPFQLFLLENPTAAAVVEPSSEIPAHTRKKHPGRREIPEHVPVERIEYFPDETTCSGCGKDLVRIGEEVTKELDYIPANLVLREYAKIKLACSCCKSGVSIGKLPPGVPLVEKGRVGPGLLSQTVVSKFCDHLPLNRQEEIFKRQGVVIPRSTQCDWVGQAADLLEPIYKELLREVMASKYVQMDETHVKFQDADNYLHTGYLWAMRSGGAPLAGVFPTVVFDFNENRSKEVPLRMLESFEGFLQVDGYAGYNEIALNSKITRVGCWAHVRRKFFEAQTSSALKSHEMVSLIKKLYSIEREIKEKPPDEKLLLRLNQSRPVLEQIKARSEDWLTTELPKSTLYLAAQYLMNQWQELTAYIADAQLRIDNNAIEQQMRPVAIGRKNYLFFGSVEGGRRAAIIYSVINTCKLCGVEPFAYLQDVFRRVHFETKISALTPRGWKKSLS